MSKGPGRVQRGVLNLLAAGPYHVALMAMKLRASQESTRRALRTLQREGKVRRVGFAGRGVCIWCLSADYQACMDYLPDAELMGQITRLMGPRFAASYVRSRLSML